MDAFSPGEKLDDGVAQELQPLVVIDPGVGGGDGGGKRARFKVRGRIGEEGENQQMNQPQKEILGAGGGIPGGRGVILAQTGHDVDQRVDTWKEEAESGGSWGWSEGQKRLTLLPHVHVVDLPVSVLGLADSAVGQRVAGVVGIHAKVEVMAGVGHGELGGGRGQSQPVRNKQRARKENKQQHF